MAKVEKLTQPEDSSGSPLLDFDRELPAEPKTSDKPEDSGSEKGMLGGLYKDPKLLESGEPVDPLASKAVENSAAKSNGKAQPEADKVGQEPNQQEQEKEKIVINLPEDIVLVKKLQNKLEEYKARQELHERIMNDSYKAPEQLGRSEDTERDARYKIAVLGQLIKKGSVDVEALSEEMKKQEGGGFRQDAFDTASFVIGQYANPDGPKGIAYGTGLRDLIDNPRPETPKPPEKVETVLPERSPEIDKKIIADFDVETAARKAEKIKIEGQIKQREEQKELNIQTGKAAENKYVDQDLEDWREGLAVMVADLKAREPNKEEKQITKEIKGIDKELKKQNKPAKAKKLEQQKAEMLEKLDNEKLDKIREYDIDAMATSRRKGEEASEQRKERAAVVLSDPNVIEAMKDKRDAKEVAKAFRALTGGESLAQQRNEMVNNHYEAEGRKVLRGEKAVGEYRQQIIDKEMKKRWEAEALSAKVECWNQLSEKERNKFGENRVESAEFGKYLDEKREELGLTDIQFYQMVNDGYRAKDTKAVGFWGKLLGGGVAVKSFNEKGERVGEWVSKESFKGWATNLVKQAAERIEKQAQEKADEKIKKGKDELLAVRRDYAGKIIQKKVEDYNIEKQQKIAQKAIEQQQAEMIKRLAIKGEDGAENKDKPKPRATEKTPQKNSKGARVVKRRK